MSIVVQPLEKPVLEELSSSGFWLQNLSEPEAVRLEIDEQAYVTISRRPSPLGVWVVRTRDREGRAHLTILTKTGYGEAVKVLAVLREDNPTDPDHALSL